MYTINDLYDLEHTLAKDYLAGFTYPWEALKGIKDMILYMGERLPEEYAQICKLTKNYRGKVSTHADKL